MFTPATWARIAAGAFVALAIGVAALQTHEGEPLIAASLAVSAPLARNDPLAEALERCQGLGLPATDPQACEHVWADNRRRFLGLPLGPAQRADSGQTASGPPR